MLQVWLCAEHLRPKSLAAEVQQSEEVAPLECQERALGGQSYHQAVYMLYISHHSVSLQHLYDSSRDATVAPCRESTR